ncbi:MAG TPA: MATE family efflux transporter [Gaiellales bacterium]
MSDAPDLKTVLRLALPALGALAAEPLYVLGDTAIVGHVNTRALAGLALGGLLLSETLSFVTVLEYGATAKVSRLFGAGQKREALDVGVQATWFALGLGLLALGVIELVAGPALQLLAGGHTAAEAQGLLWLRIAALGSPFVLVTAAGQGWMRGFQDTRTPFAVLGIANLASVLLSLLLVQGVGLGIEGSAIANVVAQVASGATFVILLVRRGAPLAPSIARIRGQLKAARDLALRTAAFFAAFTSAAAVAARMGDSQLAAHQIGFQLWILVALALDAIAIAAQTLIGSLLGAGDVDGAWLLGRRLLRFGAMFGVAVAVVLALGHGLIPQLFTNDGHVRHQVSVLWPWFVAMVPFCGVLFALDGILLGAGDLAFMRNVTAVAALGGFLPLVFAASYWGLGLGGIWAAITSFIAIRLLAGLVHWRGRGWLVAGTVTVDGM